MGFDVGKKHDGVSRVILRFRVGKGWRGYKWVERVAGDDKWFLILHRMRLKGGGITG